MKRLLVLVALLTISTQSAYAAIVVSLPGGGPSGPGSFDWDYRAELQPDQTMEIGDFFTIYDFAGISADAVMTGEVVFKPNPTLTLAGFTFTTTVQDLGITPSLITPGEDSDAIPNVTVTLTGGGSIIPPPTPADPSVLVPVDLGILTIESAFNPLAAVAGEYSTLSHLAGSESQALGAVPVAAIPEPGSVAMMIAGLIALGVVTVRRRQMD
jgi:hypothetical protein